MRSQVMSSTVQLLRRFCADQSGTTAIEYAMIAAGIGATIAAAVYSMGSQVKTALWEKVGNAM